MKNNKIYDLKKRSFVFSLDVIGFLKSLERNYISQVIANQLLRSATSIGANIAEAYASSSKKDFANFYNTALKSANETRYWLALLECAKLVGKSKISKLQDEVEELAKILAKSLITIRNK